MSDKAAINIKIDSAIKREAQKRLIDERLTMTEIVERFLCEWAKGHIQTPAPCDF